MKKKKKQEKNMPKQEIHTQMLYRKKFIILWILYFYLYDENKKVCMQSNTFQRKNKQMNKENMFLRIHMYVFKCKMKWKKRGEKNKALFCFKEYHKSHRSNWSMGKNMRMR